MISRPAKPRATGSMGSREAGEGCYNDSKHLHISPLTASCATTSAICNSVTYPMCRVKIPGKSAKTLDIRFYQAQSVA
jgi:hypothetical protein